MQQPPQNASDADIHFEDHQRLAFIAAQLQAHVGHTHHFPPIHVDDLLVEQIALDPQHVFIGMVWVKAFVAELNAIERDAGDLVVANGEPGSAGANEVTIDTSRVNYGNDGSVFNAANQTMLEIVDGKAQEFREVKESFRHRLDPGDYCPADSSLPAYVTY